MKNKRNRTSHRAHELTHVGTVIKVVNGILKFLNADGVRLETLYMLNSTILLLYAKEGMIAGSQHVDADEAVRANAEDLLGAPVAMNQVLGVRKFIGSLFSEGQITAEDVRR